VRRDAFALMWIEVALGRRRAPPDRLLHLWRSICVRSLLARSLLWPRFEKAARRSLCRGRHLCDLFCQTDTTHRREV